jgi:hypothetical protein
MPGGNPTIKTERLDLESFLERKRKPLDSWLIQNNITSEQALQDFIKNSEWSISENLIQTIQSFFVVVQPEKPKEVIDVVVQKIETVPPPPPAPIVVEEVKEQPKEVEQEVAVVSESEEIVPFSETEEEVAETRAAAPNRERKKNR